MSESIALGLLLAASSAAAVSRDVPALTLARAAQLALSQSALAGGAAASRESAAAARDLAQDAFSPMAAVKATPGYASGLPVTVAGEVPAAAGIEVRQTIYDPSLRADALEARAQEARDAASSSETNQAAVSRAVELYETVRTDESRLSARADILRARTGAAFRAAALSAEGRLAPLEADRATLEADLAGASHAEAQAALAADRLALGNFLGLAELPPLSDDPLRVVPEPDENVTAVDADPTLTALGDAIDLFERSERTRSRLFAPSIAGEAQYLRLSNAAGYDRYFNHFKADDFTIGIAISLPLWTGGAARDSVRKTRAERQVLENRRRQKRDDLELTRVRARADLSITRRRLELARRSRELSERDLERIRTLESDGRSDPDAVAKAEIVLGQSRESEADAELSAIRARLAALKSDGLLSPDRFGRTASNP